MSNKERRNELGQRASVTINRIRSLEEEVVFGDPGLFREVILLAIILRLKGEVVALERKLRRT